MEKNEESKPGVSFTSLHKTTEGIQQEFMFYISPGAKFDDIYIDAQVVSEELKICKRIVTNMRKAGKLSYTYLDEKGKVYYLRQEIAAILKANIVTGKNSPSGKAG